MCTGIGEEVAAALDNHRAALEDPETFTAELTAARVARVLRQVRPAATGLRLAQAANPRLLPPGIPAEAVSSVPFLAFSVSVLPAFCGYYGRIGTAPRPPQLRRGHAVEASVPV